MTMSFAVPVAMRATLAAGPPWALRADPQERGPVVRRGAHGLRQPEDRPRPGIALMGGALRTEGDIQHAGHVRLNEQPPDLPKTEES